MSNINQMSQSLYNWSRLTLIKIFHQVWKIEKSIFHKFFSNYGFCWRCFNPPPAANLRFLVNVVKRLISLSEEFCDSEVDHHNSFWHVIQAHDEVVWFYVSKINNQLWTFLTLGTFGRYQGHFGYSRFLPVNNSLRMNTFQSA